jgi:hypothetical protein
MLNTEFLVLLCLLYHLLFYCFINLPLFPFFVRHAHVHEPHVEEGGKDKGEEGDGRPTHQVQDRPEVGDRLRDEEQGSHNHRAEGNTLPVEICAQL